MRCGWRWAVEVRFGDLSRIGEETRGCVGKDYGYAINWEAKKQKYEKVDARLTSESCLVRLSQSDVCKAARAANDVEVGRSVGERGRDGENGTMERDVEAQPR